MSIKSFVARFKHSVRTSQKTPMCVAVGKRKLLTACFLLGLRKITKYRRVASIMTEILTQSLPKPRLQRYRYTSQLGILIQIRAFPAPDRKHIGLKSQLFVLTRLYIIIEQNGSTEKVRLVVTL
jgi:hypothetical protein